MLENNLLRRKQDTKFFRSLEFIRMAQQGDQEQLITAGGSLWRDMAGRDVWMHPSGIIQYGLQDKMREKLAETQIDIQQEETSLDVRSLQHKQDKTVLGGHTEDWRWDVIDADGVVMVVLDNKPLVDRKRQVQSEADDVPKFQHVCIPQDDLVAILQTFV